METVSKTATDSKKINTMVKCSAKHSPLIQKLLKGGGITMQIRQVTTLHHTNSAIQHMDEEKLQKCVNKHGFDKKFQDFLEDMTAFVVT